MDTTDKHWDLIHSQEKLTKGGESTIIIFSTGLRTVYTATVECVKATEDFGRTISWKMLW